LEEAEEEEESVYAKRERGREREREQLTRRREQQTRRRAPRNRRMQGEEISEEEGRQDTRGYPTKNEAPQEGGATLSRGRRD